MQIRQPRSNVYQWAREQGQQRPPSLRKEEEVWLMSEDPAGHSRLWRGVGDCSVLTYYHCHFKYYHHYYTKNTVTSATTTVNFSIHVFLTDMLF